MKVHHEPISQDFRPFTLKIDVESKEEAIQLYTLFNHANICQKVIPALDHYNVRQSILASQPNGLDYKARDAWHDKMCEIVLAPA